MLGRMHVVMWWLPAGHRPALAEALHRLVGLEADGDSDDAFGWGHLPQATRWRTRACQATAA